MISGFFVRHKNIDTEKGFSIVEVLVYLAIFMVVSVASVAFLFSLKDLVGQYRLETLLYRSGTGVMEQVLLAVRQADRVVVADTVEDTFVGGKLTLENVSTTTSFMHTAGDLDLTINGEGYGDMTMDGVIVESFTVHYYPLANNREFVRIRLSLTGTINGAQSKNAVFYGGAVVRGAI
ncbi:MAG: hypothetical protein RL097_27 [Candidatus Parcubacteria bacterium]|jgi:type II secretory pathway pseudopilin PulG